MARTCSVEPEGWKGRVRTLVAGVAVSVNFVTACSSPMPSSIVPDTLARTTSLRVGTATGDVAVHCAPPPPVPSAVPSFAEAPDPALADDAQWTAVVHTTCGDIVLALDGRAAPRTVASFLLLAQSGYWRDSDCNRLTTRQAPTGVLQCGDPTGRGLGDPGYRLPLESVPRNGHYARGWVGMARTDSGLPATATEFFVVHRSFGLPPRLAPGEVPYSGAAAYSVFGRVTSGMGIVDAIAAEGGEDTRPDGPPFASISILAIDVSRS